MDGEKSTPSAELEKVSRSKEFEAMQKANLDREIRTTALGFAVESLKSAGHPSTVDVINRAKRFRDYIVDDKVS